MMSAYLTACAYRFCSIRFALVAQGVENDVKPPRRPVETHILHKEFSPRRCAVIKKSAESAHPSTLTTNIAGLTEKILRVLIESTYRITPARSNAPIPPHREAASKIITAFRLMTRSSFCLCWNVCIGVCISPCVFLQTRKLYRPLKKPPHKELQIQAMILLR